MGIRVLIATALPLSLGLPLTAARVSPQTASPPAEPAEVPSHLEAHLEAVPPEALIHPLGDETLDHIVKGLEPARERLLAADLLAAGLHSRVLRVGVASNGALVAALVKLQAGDKQSGLISVADLEQDAAQIVRIAFTALPEVGHLDCWATVPGTREFEDVHRPVFSLSVARDQLAEVLGVSEAPSDVLPHCGCLRLDSLLLRYAIDGPAAVEVHRMSGDLVDGPSLQAYWTQFGQQARQSGELDNVPRAGAVSAIVEGDRARGMVALTIDDGPHPLTTPLMLDVLRRERARATFFLVGENAEQFPELVRMIVRDGHELGNHTYSHIPLSELNPRGIWTQLRGCDLAIEQACGLQPRFVRPPGGDAGELSLRMTDKLGYTTVLWTANTGDWVHVKREAILANALSNIRAGSIILMHQGDLWSLDALPYIIRGIRASGLEVGTVSDVVGTAAGERWDPAELVALARKAHTDTWQAPRADG